MFDDDTERAENLAVRQENLSVEWVEANVKNEKQQKREKRKWKTWERVRNHLSLWNYRTINIG